VLAYDSLNTAMSPVPSSSLPPAPGGKLPPVDLTESVAGEEDPGASLDMPPAAKPGAGNGICPVCCGSGKIASGTCSDCQGSGKRTVGAAGA
jgi:hypothetical protein